jgi:hypothetical protein
MLGGVSQPAAASGPPIEGDQAAPGADGWSTGGDGSDVLDAKLIGPARQEFIELRLGRPDNLVLQHLYQPVDGRIADYGLEHPVVLVLQIYEHREGLLPLLKDGNERNHVVRHGRL